MDDIGKLLAEAGIDFSPLDESNTLRADTMKAMEAAITVLNVGGPEVERIFGMLVPSIVRVTIDHFSVEHPEEAHSHTPEDMAAMVRAMAVAVLTTLIVNRVGLVLDADHFTGGSQ